MQDKEEESALSAGIIIIGNEILSGRTREGNLSYIALGLARAGLRLAEARIIPDLEERIAEAVNELRAAFNYVFTTGGIGPTHDDVTARAVASAFGLPLERNREAVALLERHYAPDVINEARRSMADMPKGAVLIENPVSLSPGFRIGNVFVMAGVPKIMEAMFDGILPGLAGGAAILSRTVSAYLAEGDVAAGLGGVQDRHKDVEIGSYPFFQRGRLGTSIVLRGADPARLDAAAGEVRDLMRNLGADPADTDLAAD